LTYLSNVGISEKDLREAMLTGQLKLDKFNSSGFDIKSKFSPSSRYGHGSKFRDKKKKKKAKIRKYTSMKSSLQSLTGDLNMTEQDTIGDNDSIFLNLDSGRQRKINKSFQRSISMGAGIP
jgi:hypothetical protein